MKKCLAPFVLLTIQLAYSSAANAQKGNTWELKSPDGKITITIEAAGGLTWSVKHENTVVLSPSALALTLAGGEVLGANASVSGIKTTSAQSSITPTNYKKSTIADNYNQLLVNCKKNFSVLFRAYNDGVAYRFVTDRKDSLTITSETADFNFDNDYKAYVPYVTGPRYNNDQFQTSFEALYEERKLSEFNKDTIGFLPVLIALNDGKKALITEADLENYPGMYVRRNTNTPNSLQSVHAPYPTAEKSQHLDYIVTSRANYIARTAGTSSPHRRCAASATGVSVSSAR